MKRDENMSPYQRRVFSLRAFDCLTRIYDQMDKYRKWKNDGFLIGSLYWLHDHPGKSFDDYKAMRAEVIVLGERRMAYLRARVNRIQSLLDKNVEESSTQVRSQ
jgi:hypothetical protein